MIDRDLSPVSRFDFERLHSIERHKDGIASPRSALATDHCCRFYFAL